MVAIFEWLGLTILCLVLFGIVLLLLFALVCLVIGCAKTIKKEVERDE